MVIPHFYGAIEKGFVLDFFLTSNGPSVFFLKIQNFLSSVEVHPKKHPSTVKFTLP